MAAKIIAVANQKEVLENNDRCEPVHSSGGLWYERIVG